MPEYIKVEIRADKMKLSLAKDSITENLPSAATELARGWNTTWVKIPERYYEKTNTLIIATSNKYKVGTYNLTYHELAHGLDYFGNYSGSVELIDARKADLGQMGEYYRQAGFVGQSEAFAESFARFYGGDPSFENNWPSLYRYMKHINAQAQDRNKAP